MTTCEKEERSSVLEIKEAATTSKQRLQMIESCVKLYAAWVSRADQDAGIASFAASWKSLVTFVNALAVLKLECAFLWKLYYEVAAMSDAFVTNGRILGELQVDVLLERQIINKGCDGRAAQFKFYEADDRPYVAE